MREQNKTYIEGKNVKHSFIIIVTKKTYKYVQRGTKRRTSNLTFSFCFSYTAEFNYVKSIHK